MIRCAPNGSAYNKIECAMSPLNICLVNVAKKIKPMYEWAEKDMNNCSSMGDVRTKADVLLQIQEEAISRVAILHEIKTHRSMRKTFEECLKCLS